MRTNNCRGGIGVLSKRQQEFDADGPRLASDVFELLDREGWNGKLAILSRALVLRSGSTSLTRWGFWH